MKIQKIKIIYDMAIKGDIKKLKEESIGEKIIPWIKDGMD